MLKFLINSKTGYTIDERYPCEEPCPKCGSKVYHVLEDNYTCFCTGFLCDFQDKTMLPKGQSWKAHCHQEIWDLFEQCYTSGGAIHLKDNSKYPWIKRPIIIMQDVLNYDYKIREWCGKDPFDGSYNEETPVCKSYSNRDEMIDDGWRPQ